MCLFNLFFPFRRSILLLFSCLSRVLFLFLFVNRKQEPFFSVDFLVISFYFHLNRLCAHSSSLDHVGLCNLPFWFVWPPFKFACVLFPESCLQIPLLPLFYGYGSKHIQSRCLSFQSKNKSNLKVSEWLLKWPIYTNNVLIRSDSARKAFFFLSRVVFCIYFFFFGYAWD